MIILGVGGMLGEAASAVLKDGELVAAIEQKKLAHHHHPGQLPEEAIAECLRLAGAAASNVDIVAVVRPFSTGAPAERHLELRAKFPNSRVVMVEHHAAHAASAYYPSGFEHATVLTLDRSGDFRCGARWQASGNRLELDEDLYYPDSLGDFYGRVTELLGFEPGGDEHKVQWLSTTGDDRFVSLFSEILTLKNGNWPRVDRSFFDTDRVSQGGFNERFFERLGVAYGEPVPAPLHPHIARGAQEALECAALQMAGSGENLCLAGGVALNALLVAAFERSGKWKRVFAQPAAGNAGTAIGAACHAWNAICHESKRPSLGSLCLGPSFGPEEIKRVLENCKLRFRYLLTDEELIETAVREIDDDKIVAWMHGRMEFGARALGNRSILASPRNPYSTENLNTYIKHREQFRKFAASAPAELVGEYFDVGENARFLATVGRVKPAHRKTFESAILGRDLVRVHIVHKEDNPLYWRLLHAAGKSTGLPVLYNTSFNLFGDPLVCTPRDAVRSFYSSGIDAMFVGHFLLEK